MAKKKKTAVESETAPGAEPADFERLMAELEETVEALEAGQLSLDEALKRYEKGVDCLKKCYQALQTAEQKIEVLAKIDDEGNVTTVPLDDPIG